MAATRGPALQCFNIHDVLKNSVEAHSASYLYLFILFVTDQRRVFHSLSHTEGMLRQRPVRATLLRRNILGDSNELDGEEFKLPKLASLAIVIAHNIMLADVHLRHELHSMTLARQKLSFFIFISSSEYAEYVDGSATESGVVIRIPSLFSGIILIPMTRYDKGRYTTALHIGRFASILGYVAYAIAYRANFLHLIFIGRCLTGISFLGLMYCKRYCTDPLIVGDDALQLVSDWTSSGSDPWSVPRGVLYNVGFQSAIFNGYTSPARYFEDVPTMEMSSKLHEITTSRLPPSVDDRKQIGGFTPLPSSAQTTRSPSPPEDSFATQLSHITHPQWGLLSALC
ncbi:hypothetical protein J3R83DRAFT_10277 [Lanmaoa asiatica]|nr:hypothetical protein J3R83DRAFT_10277 [Lanmaoa asiatica]